MGERSLSSRTAASLTEEYLACLERRDVDAAFSLLRADAVSEWPYLPPGLQTLYPTRDSARPFVGLVIEGLLETVSIRDLDITEAGPDLCFAEFRSDCRTKKGVPYRNRYIIKVQAVDGEIVLWREYCDPQAAIDVT